MKPNAPLAEVTKEQKNIIEPFGKKVFVIVIGGSNDNNGGKQLINHFQIILKLSSHTNVIVAGLLNKHHSPELNNEVSYISMELKRLIDNANHASFLPLCDLSCQLHTKHGLHFNKLGRRLT